MDTATTLMVNVATPASAAEHWQEEIDLAMQLAPALAGGKTLESKMETINDTAYIVFSGEGAANVALAIRDELGKNFPGSASLPEGPKK